MSLQQRGWFLLCLSLFLLVDKDMMAEYETVILGYEMEAVCWRQQSSNKLEEGWVPDCQVSSLSQTTMHMLSMGEKKNFYIT